METEATDDGEIFERVEAPLRSTATLAGMAVGDGARRAAARAVNDRNRDERGLQEARSREQAMLASSRASLERVFDPGWIDRASPREIADRWQEAAAWSGRDRRADEAMNRVRDLVRERYGIDISALDREILEQSIARGMAERENEDQSAAQELSERDAAATAMDQADRLDDMEQRADTPEAENAAADRAGEARKDGAVAFDSAERLEGEVQRLADAGLAEHQVQDAMLVELSHSHPANTVVRAGGRSGSRKAVRARGFSRAKVRTRRRGAGLGR